MDESKIRNDKYLKSLIRAVHRTGLSKQVNLVISICEEWK